MKHDDAHDVVSTLKSLRPGTVDHLTADTFFRAGWAAAECSKCQCSIAKNTRSQSFRKVAGAFAGGLVTGLLAILFWSTMFRQDPLPDLAENTSHDEQSFAPAELAPSDAGWKDLAKKGSTTAIVDLSPADGSISECLSAAARQSWYRSFIGEQRSAAEHVGPSYLMNPRELRDELDDYL